MSQINANSGLNKMENNGSKPINFGLDVSSWNYGCFYQIPSYCNTKIQHKKENLSSVSNEVNNANPKNENRDTNMNQNRTKEKIIKDEYVKNMNLLKIIGTSKNISNKPVKIINPISNKIIVNHTLINNINNNKANKTFKTNDKNDTKEINEGKESINNEDNSVSQIKFRLKYEDWVEIKKEESLIDQNLKMIKNKEIKKIDEFKKKLKKEYEPIRNAEYNNWLNKKKEQNKLKLKEKLEQKKEKELKEQQKKMISEEKLNNWILKQAFNIEKENKIKKLKEDNEKKIKEQEENYKKLRNSDAKKAYSSWLIKKEQEKMYNEQLKSMGLLTEKNNSKRQPESRASNSVKYKLVIGPYSNAKILRDMKTQVENQLNNIETYMNERENYEENDQEYEENENMENEMENENNFEVNNHNQVNNENQETGDMEIFSNNLEIMDENIDVNKDEIINNDGEIKENDVDENVENDNMLEFNDIEFDEEYYNNLNDDDKEIYFYNQLRMKGYTDDQIEQLRNAQYENYEEDN